jgi:UDP-glucose 4-epimerase
MNILVTGGAGYIGSHAVEQLVEKGHQVTVLDNFSTGHRTLLNPNAKLVEGAIQDIDLVHRTLKSEKTDAIIHFAAFTSVAESMANPEKFYTNNFGGTLSLLEAAKDSSLKYFIFSSTAAVYSDPGSKKVTEESNIDPVSPYGKSKWMSEQALIDSARKLNLHYGILRYFNVAGASPHGKIGQFGDSPGALVKSAALAAVGKIPQLSINGTDYPTKDGTAERDYIHVSDLAELHLLALEALTREPSLILNCGYGHGFSVREVIQTMQKVSQTEFKVTIGPRRPGDLVSVVADTAKLNRQLKWKPRYDDLELICKTAFEWEVRCLRAAK